MGFGAIVSLFFKVLGWFLSLIGAKKASKAAYQKAAQASADLGKGSVDLNESDSAQQEDLQAQHDKLNK